MAIIHKIRVLGEKMEDVTFMPKFNYVVCSIDELKHLDTLSIYEMQGSLLVYEKKVIQQEKEEQDLKASTNNNAWLPSRSAYRG